MRILFDANMVRMNTTLNERMEEKSIGTLIEINPKLLQEALDLSDYPTPTELIEAALQEYIQRQRQLKIVELFGTIDYDEDYHYKEQRQIG